MALAWKKRSFETGGCFVGQVRWWLRLLPSPDQTLVLLPMTGPWSAAPPAAIPDLARAQQDLKRAAFARNTLFLQAFS